MTANEVYQLPTIQSSHEFYEFTGCYYCHLYEIEETKYDWQHLSSPEVEIRLVGYKNYDGRRIWKLSTVWFRENPVMIIQNAGRGGDDHFERFITDKTTYLQMLEFIRSLIIPDEILVDSDIIDPNENIHGLTHFYRDSL